MRKAWPIAQPALLTSCDPATAPEAIVATTASASPGETSLITSNVSIALTGISALPTSAWPGSESLRIFARAVTSWRLQPSACAAPSRV